MNYKNQLKGSCHCKNISFTLKTNKEEKDLTPRTCQCSLCKKHEASYISDPEGILELSYNEEKTTKYRFGHSTADFLICKNCGVLTMALCDFEDESKKAVINIKAMEAYKFAEPIETVFDEESKESRLERRYKNWTGSVSITKTL